MAQRLNEYVNAPYSTGPEEAENARLHAIHDAGYEANYDGVLLQHNPHPPLSIEFNAWEAGHLQAQNTRTEWEECNRERAKPLTGDPYIDRRNSEYARWEE
jgi:hypothetical protein